MRKNIAIIGSGLSGITIASELKKKFNVEIFEKSRGVGGRMSTRKELPFIFDHGAQFFKITKTDFMNFVSELLSERVILPWKFKLAHFEGIRLTKIKIIGNEDKFFVGVPNMDSIIKYLAKKIDVMINTKIEKIIKKKNDWFLYDQNNKSYGKYDWVILTLPAEQSRELISKTISFYPLLKKIKMKGCFSLMIGMNDPVILDYDAAIIKDSDVAWLAINSSKPFRTEKYSLLINSSYDFAAKNISSPKEKIINHLLDTTSVVINRQIPESAMIRLHQWRYVEAEKHPDDNFFIDPQNKIGICGDWFVNSRVEGAFISASNLSKEIIKHIFLN